MSARPARTTSLILLGLATALIIIAVMAVAGAFGSGVLRGDRRHDFGLIELTQDGKGHATHTFTLTNVSDEPVEILASKTSCGCTATNDLAGKVVQPGETLDIEATMTLSSSIEKRVRLTLNLGRHGEMILFLAGKGRRADPLYARRSPIELIDSRASQNVYLESDSTETPATLTVEATGDLVVSAGQWRLERQPDHANGRPAVWAATIEVERTGDHADESRITMRSGDLVASVPVTGARVRPPAVPPSPSD